MRSTQWCRWAICLLALAVLALAADWYASFPDLQAQGLVRIVLWLVFFVCGLVVTFTFPNRLAVPAQITLIFVLALVPRYFLLPAAPTNDINRYLWEGMLLRSGISPYAQTADSPEMEPYRDQFWPEINHKNRTTVYPPLVEYVFAAVGYFSYTTTALKITFILADLATLALLLILLQRHRAPPRWALLYALNPISLISVAAEAHFDALFVLALIAFLLAAETKRLGWAWVLLGIAIQLKLVAILLIPVLGFALGWKKWWGGALALILPGLPFVLDVPTVLGGIWEFGGRSDFNSSILTLLNALTGNQTASAIICGLLLLGILWLACTLPLTFAQRCFLALGGLLCFSSVIHFWYLLWVLPFVALMPSVAWLYLTATMSLYLLTWYHNELGQGWLLPAWAQAVIWIPFYLLLFLERRQFLLRWWRGKKRAAASICFPQVETVSILIPTYNAAEQFESLATNLAALHPAPKEILIVDGGSQDATTQLTRDEGWHLIHATGGRGGQLRAGFDHTTGDVVMVLHADCTIPTDALRHIVDTLNTNQQSPGGCLGQRFDSPAPQLLLIEALNEWRATLHGTSFGDQVQFFRRSAAEQFAEFPDPPLMEDVELSIQLNRLGRPLYLGKEDVVSADKWRRHDFGSRFGQVVSFMLRYHWHWNRRRELTADMYERYYGRRPD